MSFDDIFSNALSVINNSAGVNVTYTRGTDTVSVKATVGSYLFKSESTDGFYMYEKTRDYLIPANDLILNDETIEPKKGDTITEVLNGVSYTWKVYAPNGEPVFSYSDTGNKHIRVHTIGGNNV